MCYIYLNNLSLTNYLCAKCLHNIHEKWCIYLHLLIIIVIWNIIVAAKQQYFSNEGDEYDYHHQKYRIENFFTKDHAVVIIIIFFTIITSLLCKSWRETNALDRKPTVVVAIRWMISMFMYYVAITNILIL